MVKVFKWLLLGVLTLMGLAWKLVQGFFALMPDDAELQPVNRPSSVSRAFTDAPDGAVFTDAGDPIID